MGRTSDRERGARQQADFFGDIFGASRRSPGVINNLFERQKNRLAITTQGYPTTPWVVTKGGTR